jgi:hypothetical protein
MKRVLVYCEGPTEETFTREILASAFYSRDILMIPVVFGGVSKYSIIKKKLSDLCKSDTSAIVATPEHINNNPNTAPSKRILKIYPEYNKVLDGYNIAKFIGIDKIRVECRHFDKWLSKLEHIIGTER